MSEWYKSWFDTKYYSMLYQHRDITEADHFVKSLDSILDIEVGTKLLDLACGEGRHSRIFSNLGCQVTGIDLSSRNINHAIHSSAHTNIDFYVHDMCQAFRYNYFDVVVNMFTSFGYFTSPRMERKVVQGISYNLKQDGYFILDYLNTSALSIIEGNEVKKLINAAHFTITKKIERQWLIKRIRIIDQSQEYNYSEQIKLYTVEDLIELFRASNLHLVHLYGDYELSEYYDKSSPRMIFLFQKK